MLLYFIRWITASSVASLSEQDRKRDRFDHWKHRYIAVAYECQITNMVHTVIIF